MDPVIHFDHVSKRFSDTQAALEDVTFSIQPGEFVFITGPSGSGKTTIMRLLAKEYEPSSGEITYQGTPLTEISQGKIHHHRRKIGVVFQDFKLLPDLNIWENIALPLSIIGQPQAEIEQRVTDLLNLIDMKDKAFLFPSQLSGGEAQRVSIARALAPAPSVIFADEPTGNLDTETSLTIAKLLHTINKLGTTVLFATHDVSVLAALENERHLRLEKGRLVSDTGSGKNVTFVDKHPASTKSDSHKSKDEKEEKTSKKKAYSEPDISEPESKSDSPELNSEKTTAHSRKKSHSWWPFKKSEKTSDTPESTTELDTTAEEDEA